MDEALDQPASPAETPAAGRSKKLTIGIAVVLVAICGGIAWASNRNTGDGGPARATTCEEWAAKGDTNKVIQAREMLTALRSADGLDAPETAVAQRFANGLTNVCASSSTSTLSELAAGLYVSQRSTFG